MIYALHGAVGDCGDWRGFAKGMKDVGEAVARVDLWEFLSCCPMPIREFGAAFNGEVSSVGNVLLGYSMGGRLALHGLLDDPGKWGAAVIVGAHTGLGEGERLPRQVADAEWAGKALVGEWDDFLGEWNSQGVLDGVGMPDRSLLKSRRQAVARSFMDWSLGMQDDLLGRLGEISCPVLWVVGERDVKFREIGERAVEVLPQGELCVVEDCGHRVPWEREDLFLERVKEFLEKCG